MSDLIRIKCGELGDRNEMPTLQYSKTEGAEIAVRIDEKELYVGSPNGNIRLCGAKDLEKNNIELNKIYGLIEQINARLDNLEKSNEQEGSE